MSEDTNISLPGGDPIDVEVPLRNEYAATLRLFVAALGAEAGFSIDELDDLKLAVSEVFTQMVEASEGSTGARAHLRLTMADGSLGLHLTATPSASWELDPLSGAILASVVDAHHLAADGIRLVKSVTESVA